MKDTMVRIAAIHCPSHLADCTQRAEELVKAAEQYAKQQVQILLTPELGLTGYTCGDLFFQTPLLEAVLHSLQYICQKTAHLPLLLVVGLPVRFEGKLYNCAAFIAGGTVLGLVPKTHLPNYGEFYELRQFNSGEGINATLHLPPFGEIPFSNRLLFCCKEMPGLRVAAEICEDLWVPNPPSVQHALAGATVVLNLSASNETVGKADYRKMLVQSQSARLCCAYAYADAGYGESTGDMVFSGHHLLCENGQILSEAPPFSQEPALADIDIELLLQERCRLNTFPANTQDYRRVEFHLNEKTDSLLRIISKTPFVPHSPSVLRERCETILTIQAEGLRRRLDHTAAKTAFVGVSGGLDSTLALLVAARAFSLLSKDNSGIVALTMPGFGTTNRTKNNAHSLCKALGVHLQEVDITPSVRQHFLDIHHPETLQNVTYENAQARMRTLVLMDMANQNAGLVVGTGDLSELALGWATYNGDHMSMYGVNAGIPKTLVRSLVAHEAERLPVLAEVLRDILATPVSPELLPPKEGEISQETEQIVGPYELHDFFLFYMLRYGFSPKKILQLALHAFGKEYTEAEILRWMDVFYRRFFSQQFKRSCLPDGPKVGSVSLSPRGDWRMPSDAIATAFVSQIQALIEKNNEV